MRRRLALAALALTLTASVATAQTVDLSQIVPNGGATATARIIQMAAVLTVLSVAPGLLIMVTSFTRFTVALSFLRTGLGLQSAPANLVLISLSLFMTFFVMAPTFDKAWRDGLQPLMDNKISQEQAFGAITLVASATTQKWWAVCKPCQEPLPNRAEGEWWADMEEVFHTD